MMKEEEPSTAVPEASPEDNAKTTTETGGEPKAAASSSSRRPLYLGLGIFLVIAAVLCITLPLTLRDDNDNRSNGSNSEGVVDGQKNFNGNGSNGLPLFSEDVTEGYANGDEFEMALQQAIQREVGAFIVNNFRGETDESQSGARPPTAQAEPMMEDSAMVAESAADGDAVAGGSGSEGVTDFETNNQEDNVDEADIIKADANFVYAAYGDYIVVWDTQGSKVAQVAMPPIDLPDDWGTPQTETSKVDAKSSMIAPGGGWTPKPNIRSMLLTDNHLVAVVSGYNDNYYSGYQDGQEQQQEAHVLYEYKGSQIRLYEKTNTGDLTFVGSKDINGHFVDARSIGDVVHLATASGVDIWTHLWRPLDRYNFAMNITDDEYQQQATTLASKLVPEMARKLRREISLDTDELPTMLQLNQWMTTEFGAVADDNTEEDGPGFTMPFQSYDVVSNMGQVTTFNVNDELTDDGDLSTSASAYMAPSYFDTLYGTEDHLVLATSGWDWDASLGESTQTTYLVALEIDVDAASTNFLSVGTLKGHLLNSYALDIVGNELRAATTVERNQWWWGGPRPMPMDDGMLVDVAMVEDVAVQAVSAQASGTTSASDQCVGPPAEDDTCSTQESYEECLALAGEGCEVIIQTLNCPPTFSCADSESTTSEADPDELCPSADAGCMNDENYQDCLKLVESGCVSILPMESCPLQFSCERFEDDQPIIAEPTQNPEDEESRTENYMIVLTLTPGQMTEKGRVQIGLKNERITSVRFFDNVAYAVTFERTDPFYVLDMSVPEVLGELKLPGFSSYLHSMNADNTLLLAVGQNATDDGLVTGLMVTVFDATTPSAPVALVSHTFENDDNAWSSSSIEWDYKAFRYVDGKLIMPVDIWYNQQWNMETQEYDPLPDGLENFQGFAVMDISTTSISERYRVSHMREQGVCTYCGGYLPTRSFVYSGDLMTVRDNSVVSTDLTTGEEMWRLNLSVDGEANECCY